MALSTQRKAASQALRPSTDRNAAVTQTTVHKQDLFGIQCSRNFTNSFGALPFRSPRVICPLKMHSIRAAMIYTLISTKNLRCVARHLVKSLQGVPLPKKRRGHARNSDIGSSGWGRVLIHTGLGSDHAAPGSATVSPRLCLRPTCKQN